MAEETYSLGAPPAVTSRVLVVDDDTYIRDVVAQLLASEGYAVEEAANGVEALRIVSDATRRPDLILLDLMMPVMDGWEFARRLQEQRPRLDIPIIVLSAARLPSDRLGVTGAEAVLAKPFDLDELLEHVEQWAQGRDGA